MITTANRTQRVSNYRSSGPARRVDRSRLAGGRRPIEARASWHRIVRLPVVIVCCALLVLGWRSAVGNESTLIGMTPDSTRAFVVVDNFPLAWRQLAGNDQGEQPFALDVDSFDERFGIAGATIARHASGAILRAEVILSRERSAELLLVFSEQGDQLAKAEEETLLARGAESTAFDVAGFEATQYAWTDAEGERRTCISFFTADGFVVSDRIESIQQVAAIARGDEEGSLIAQEAFMATWKTRPVAGGDAEFSVSWYVDLWRRESMIGELGTSSDQDGQASLEQDEGYQFALRHGLRGIETVVGRVDIGAGRREFATSHVRVPEPRRGSMKMSSVFEGASEWSVPAWISDSVDNVTILNADVPTAMKEVGPLFDDAFADGIQGTYQQLLDDLQGEFGLDIDLAADLYAFLGPRVCVIGDVEQEGEASSLLIGFAIRDEDKVAQAFVKLMQDDPEAEQVKLNDAIHPLWVVPGDGGPNDFILGIADSWAIYANDLELVKETLLKREDESSWVARFDLIYNATVQELGKRETGSADELADPFLISISPKTVAGSDEGQAWRHPLELLFASPDQLQQWLSTPDSKPTANGTEWLASFGSYPLIVGYLEKEGWRLVGLRDPEEFAREAE